MAKPTAVGSGVGTTLPPFPRTRRTRWPWTSERSSMLQPVASKMRNPSRPSMDTSASRTGWPAASGEHRLERMGQFVPVDAEWLSLPDGRSIPGAVDWLGAIVDWLWAPGRGGVPAGGDISARVRDRPVAAKACPAIRLAHRWAGGVGHCVAGRGGGPCDQEGQVLGAR